jgi:coenzyme F420-0:L-glutamate ligase/coenzyme F420-1:gamma-L-glutamate ligase
MMPRDAAQVLSDIARSRRSIRRYQDKPVPRQVLNDLLEAARWAPSAHNRQPWRFAVVESEATKRALAAAMGERLKEDLERDGAPRPAIDADVLRSYARITRAPALIVACVTMRDMDVYSDSRRKKAEWTMAGQSVAMAVENLLLSAHALGLGACWMCAPLFVPDTVREVLKLDADWDPQALITIGYPAEATTKTRVSLSSVVRYLDTD